MTIQNSKFEGMFNNEMLFIEIASSGNLIIRTNQNKTKTSTYYLLSNEIKHFKGTECNLAEHYNIYIMTYAQSNQSGNTISLEYTLKHGQFFTMGVVAVHGCAPFENKPIYLELKEIKNANH